MRPTAETWRWMCERISTAGRWWIPPFVARHGATFSQWHTWRFVLFYVAFCIIGSICVCLSIFQSGFPTECVCIYGCLCFYSQSAMSAK
jgi:hypothetical protein